jgi:hypothetical protein
MSPKPASIQALPFLAEKLITIFPIKINDLALVYSIVTAAEPVSATASGFVEFRKLPGTGWAGG